MLKITFKCFIWIFNGIFILSSIPPFPAQAQIAPSSSAVSRAPVLLKGLTIDRNDPFQFEFLIDAGDAVGAGSKPVLTQGRVTNPPLHDESLKLIKYFLASLTLPEKDLWVNLSPYEHDRIIPGVFGQTEMGRDLLSQDYILKQLTASLMSPENEQGKKFWEKVYSQSGLTDIPIETFNKVWIVPETGYFYEHNNTVFIADAKLKVMMQEDYFAREQSVGATPRGRPETGRHGGLPLQNDIKSIIRSTILPLIEEEINHGESFANLRQIYNAQLLAVWFKKRLKDHILGQVYADKKNIESLSLRGEAEAIADIESIWQKYVDAFKSGASNIIKDEYDPVSQSIIPRKYFTGGAVGFKTAAPIDFAQLSTAVRSMSAPASVTVYLGKNSAMMAKTKKNLIRRPWLYGKDGPPETSLLLSGPLTEQELGLSDDFFLKTSIPPAGSSDGPQVILKKKRLDGKDRAMMAKHLENDRVPQRRRHHEKVQFQFGPVRVFLSFLFWHAKRESVIKELRKKPLKPAGHNAAMMVLVNIAQRRFGGVDLSTDQADIQIFKSENGFEFPKMDPAMPDLPTIMPVIIDIRPITIHEVGIKLGLNIPAEDDTDTEFSRDKAKNPEQISSL